ncbi:hypothetical protein TNCV_4488561 [Trichonephila clavipes]|nr:hypothetical protein TNCV_4488561 [Trichonephila clavipes]
MHQRSSVEDGRSLPTSSDVTNQSPGLLSSRRYWSEPILAGMGPLHAPHHFSLAGPQKSAHGLQTHYRPIGVDLTMALSGPSRMHR